LYLVLCSTIFSNLPDVATLHDIARPVDAFAQRYLSCGTRKITLWPNEEPDTKTGPEKSAKKKRKKEPAQVGLGFVCDSHIFGWFVDSPLKYIMHFTIPCSD